MIAEALKNIRSDAFAKFVFQHGVLIHSVVDNVITDQGRSLCSKLMNGFLQLTKCKHLLATPYHPQTNGQAERSCKIVKDIMCHYVDENLSNWDLLLRQAVFAYNSAKQESTKESPFFLLYNREPRLLIDLEFKIPKNFKFGQSLVEQMERTKTLFELRIMDAQSKQKIEFDSKHRDVKYQVGDKVSLQTPRRQVGISEKFLPKFELAYEVMKVLSPVTYKIRKCGNPRKTKIVNVQRLKRYYTMENNELDTIPTVVNMDVDNDLNQTQ